MIEVLLKKIAYLVDKIRVKLFRFEEQVFEKKYNLTTIKHERGSTKKEYRGYAPTPIRILKLTLERININENDIFIDIGSGKGRVIIFAALYNFRKVIGLELIKEFHEDAKLNIERFKLSENIRDKIELVNDDVCNYVINDDTTIFYFANPFSIQIYSKVFDKIYNSYINNKRLIKIIIYRPVLLVKLYIEKIEWLRLIDVIEDNTIMYGKDYQVHIYEINEKWNCINEQCKLVGFTPLS